MPWYVRWWEEVLVLEHYGLSTEAAVEAVNEIFFGEPVDDDCVDVGGERIDGLEPTVVVS